MIIKHPEQIEAHLQKHRARLEHPECYLGHEPNTYHKDWDKAKFRILIASVWRYEDLRGNQTLPLLYQMINEKYGNDVICERSFFPNSEKDYRNFCDYKIPVFGLESKRSMGEYDLVLTSLSFLPPWVNFPLMLRMSGIPPFWLNRTTPDYPLFMVGGSSMYGNFSIAYPNVDMIYLGDAEPGLFPLLDAIMQERDLSSLQKQFDYIFCPSLYSPVYDGKNFKEWLHNKEYPSKLRVIKCKDLNEAPALTKPYASYMDATMGLGEVELSRGCRASCSFCGLGWKYRPYRERERKQYVEIMSENLVNSGSFKGLCPIAAEFAFYGEKRALLNDLRQLSTVVDPLSMRVDAYVHDEEFAWALGKAGMNNMAIGVEGISQRIRDWMGKGITEEDIRRACSVAIDGEGFKKIKFFLISNVDETQEDWDEFFALLKDIRAEMHGRGRKMTLKVSWTPLFVEPCTPLQWMKPTIDQKQNWKEISTRLDELGVQYPRGGGSKNNENFLYTMQGMHLGDTRFASAVSLASLEKDRPLYVSFSNDFKEILLKYMDMLHYPLDYLMREREKDEVFPWDIADRGVPKSSLFTLYSGRKSGQSKKSKPMVVTDKDTPLVIPPVHDNVGMSWYLVRYHLEEPFAVVPNVHWNAQLHRACYKQGLPIAKNSLRFFSDRACRNWYVGDDYFFVGFGSTHEHIESLLYSLNGYLYGMEITGVLELGNKLSIGKYFGGYEAEVGYTPSQMEAFYTEFVGAEKVEVLAREVRYFSGERKIPVDLKEDDIFFDLEIDTESLLKKVRVKVGNRIGIRYFLNGFFSGAAFSKLLTFPVRKTGLYFKGKHELDLVKFDG